MALGRYNRRKFKPRTIKEAQIPNARYLNHVMEILSHFRDTIVGMQEWLDDYDGDLEELLLKVAPIEDTVAITTTEDAISDEEMPDSSISFYLDEAANELKVKVKYGDGTLKTGTIALI